MKKQILLFTALICATTILANEAEFQQMDTIFVAEDTILVPHIPAPIHLDLSVARKATLADACPTDSIVGLDEKGNYVSKTEYEYDAAGNTIAEIVYSWDKNGVKTGVSRYWKKFTGITATTTINYKWDATIQDWVYRDSTQYLYYPSGKMQSNTKYVWENNAWHESVVYDYEYNSYGNLTLSMTSNWNATLQTVVPSTKREYGFDEQGNTIFDASWKYSNNEWTGTSKSEWRYDSKKNKILEAYYNGWENNDWKGIVYNSSRPNATGKTTYTYNESNKQTQKVIYTWSAGWVELNKTETQYTGTTKIGEAKYNWSGTWVGTSRDSTAWVNDTTETYTFKWDGKWVYKTKTQKANSGGNQTASLQYSWNGTKWIGYGTKWEKKFSGSLVTLYLESIWGTDDWVYSIKEETVYSGSNIKTLTKYKWVNDAWVGESQIGHEYDAKNNLIKDLTYAWNGITWIDSLRNVYVYDAANRLTSDTLSIWEGSAWRDSTLHICEYSSKNIMTLEVHATRIGEEWQAADSMKHEVVYVTVAGQEKTASDIQMTWTSKSGKWTGTSKSEFKYDDAGNTIQSNTYTFKNDDWVNKEERQYAYKDNNPNLQTLSQVMTWSTDHWVGSYKYEYEFDENNHQVSSARYTWNTSKGDWQGASKSYSAWDNGLVVQTISYNWNSTLWNWVGSFKHDYAFDAKGHQISHITSNYSSKLNEWIPQTKDEDTYDNKHADAIKTEEFYWAIEDEDDPLDGYWCHTSKVETSYDETGAGRLRYERDVTYSDTECDEITIEDMKRYYYSCDNYYVVKFVNWDDTDLDSQDVLEGYSPNTDKIKPTHAQDAQYTYVFDGWTADKDKPEELVNPDGIKITANATFYAVYKSTLRQYSVTFKDEAGNIWQSAQMFEYGTMPAYNGSTPEKEPTAQFTYTFAGWGDGLVAVEHDTTYIAKFTTEVNQYTITFVDEDGVTELDKQTLNYGETPVYAGEEPTKTATAEFTYTFAGWDKDITEVKGNATYTATYSSATNQYTILFVDEDGVTELDKQTLNYGATPVYAGEEPTKPATAEFTYTFAGWDKDITEVKGNATYTATYNSEVNNYTVTINVGEESYSKELPYGTLYAVILEAAVAEFGLVKDGDTYKYEDAEYIYTFTGWEGDVTLPEKVTESATYTMLFDKEKKTATGVEAIEQGASSVKVYENGVLYILRNGKKYTSFGTVVE